jgi:hypothetical protein
MTQTFLVRSRSGRELFALSALSLTLACGSRSGLLGELGEDPEAPEIAGDIPRPEPPSPELAPLLPSELPEEAPVEELTGCVDITHSYTSLPPTVMLLIDQSGSMAWRFGESTRWDVLRDAIIDPENGLLTWLDATASIGLMLYTSLDGDRSSFGCPMVRSVDVRFGNADEIRRIYELEDPIVDGDTPTGDSIEEAASRLNALGGAAPKYILLVTDGLPDTCAVPDPQNGIDDAVRAVERAYGQGIIVRTVGVSADIAAGPLQRMANAGAGKAGSLVYGRDADAEQPLYASTEPQALAAQLKGVIGDVRSCTVELGTLVGPGRAFEGSLTLDGFPLEYGALNGWSFVDDDTLLVHGASCDRILGEGERLEVRFPCVVEPPGRRLR